MAAMPHDVKISIITCTHNSEKFLPQALASIEKQTYTHIEHIINDSYSTDGTLQIIQDYIARNGSRVAIKFIQSEPRGVGNALNTATAMATGEVVHYLHSDDYYLDETAVERAVRHFQENPDLVWLTGNFVVEWRGRRLVLPQTLILQPNLEIALSVMNFISHENTFMKREAVKDYGGFLESKTEPVEYSLWLKLFKDHRPLILNDAFTVFIIHKGSTSTGNIFKLMKAMRRALHTQRNQHIFPLLGYYREKGYYKRLLSVKRWAFNLAEIINSRKA
jgi:glycosyltransferase involved in cell wall biosynthesis